MTTRREPHALLDCHILEPGNRRASSAADQGCQARQQSGDRSWGQVPGFSRPLGSSSRHTSRRVASPR